MARLLPKTHRWASLEAVRKAALQVDKEARRGLAQPDHVRTLFFWGFAIDQQLSQQLALHKRSGKVPIDVLPFPLSLPEALRCSQAGCFGVRMPHKNDIKVVALYGFAQYGADGACVRFDYVRRGRRGWVDGEISRGLNVFTPRRSSRLIKGSNTAEATVVMPGPKTVPDNMGVDRESTKFAFDTVPVCVKCK